MILTSARYALRALIELAPLPEGELMLGRTLSERTQIPANYLSKILLVLGKAGVVHAVRGASGGYRLAMLPEEVRLIEVVELFEGPRARSACLLDINRECNSVTPCRAHSNFLAVRDGYVRFLENTSIADISMASWAEKAATEPVRMDSRTN